MRNLQDQSAAAPLAASIRPHRGSPPTRSHCSRVRSRWWARSEARAAPGPGHGPAAAALRTWRGPRGRRWRGRAPAPQALPSRPLAGLACRCPAHGIAHQERSAQHQCEPAHQCRLRHDVLHAGRPRHIGRDQHHQADQCAGDPLEQKLFVCLVGGAGGTAGWCGHGRRGT